MIVNEIAKFVNPDQARESSCLIAQLLQTLLVLAAPGGVAFSARRHPQSPFLSAAHQIVGWAGLRRTPRP